MISHWTRARRACRKLSSWLTIGLALLLFVAVANATNYVYDANGRLVVVTNEAGESARYVYDVMGNIIRIERIDADELRVFAVTPGHGTIDSLVTIRGQGFSSTAADNTVAFNGAVAVVSSATANELKVTVPYAATTGPLTVGVGARSAASDLPFTIDDTGIPPSIGTVTPDTAVAGDPLSVPGTHLYPIPGKTSLRLGARSLDIAAGSSNAQLTAILPKSASSGRVSVQTPYGTAESLQSVFVMPPGIAAPLVTSRGVATLDTSNAHVDLINGSVYGAVLFDSEGKSWASLQLTNVMGSSGGIGYSVYAPGNVLVQQGTVSINAPSIHLNRLQSSGTYLVLFRTNDGGSSSFDVSARANAVLGDKATTLSTSAPSQSLRGVFNADAGDTLVVKIGGSTSSPAGAAVTYSVYNPNGIFYTSGITSTSGSINLPRLPTSGTWQLIAAPGIGVTANMDVSVLKGTTGALVPGPDPVHLEAQSTGQSIYMDFHAKPFESMELVLANVALTGTTQIYYELHVYAEAGNEVAYTGCNTASPGGSCNLHLWYLPEGDYHAAVVATYGGTLQLDTYLQDHLQGPTLTRDTTAGLDLSTSQVDRLSFDANAGDTFALSVSAARTSPQGQNIRFLIYRPDAGGISTTTRAYSDFTTNGTRTIDLPDLPVTGRYTILVVPDFGLASSAQISLLTGNVRKIGVNDDPVVMDASAPGQSSYVDFDATAGESVEFTLADAIATGSYYPNYSVDIRDSAGRNISSRTCVTSDPGCQLHLWYLPEGRYRATVTMNWGGAFHARVGVRDVAKGRSLTLDTPTTVLLDRGEAEQLTFHANAGDTVAFAVNSLATTPAGQEARYILYRPDAGSISTITPSYTEIKSTGARLIDLPNLPVSGDYTLAVLSDTSAGISTQVQLIRGEVGSLPADGSPQTFETRGSGQSTYVDFTAHAGENLELTLFNVTQAGASYAAISVNIRDAAGRDLGGNTCTSGGLGCEYHLWNLPAGKYRATITAGWGGTVRFDAVVRMHKAFPELKRGSPVRAELARGEAGRITFHANAGETVALLASSFLTDPAGQNVRFILYRPDAGTISTSTLNYTEFTRNGTQLLDLPNLPVSGEYTLIVIPESGTPASVSIALLDGSTGALPDSGDSQTIETNGAGQTSYMTFTANAGDNLELVFSNVVLTGSIYRTYVVDVRDQAGRYMGGGTCYSDDPGCEFHLWNLSSGAYRVTVALTSGGDFKADAAIRHHGSARILAVGSPASLDLGTGDVPRLRFHANAGDTLALQATGIVTAPLMRDVRLLIYRPDAGTITTATAPYIDVRGSANQLVELPSLPVSGDYTVLVIPSLGVPAHVRLDLFPGSTAHLTTDEIAQTVTVSAAGQSAYLDFHAEPFEDLELALFNVSQVGTTTGSYRIQVLNAANQVVSNTMCYYNDPGCDAHLWYMSEGNYRAVVTLNSGGAVQFDTSLRTHKKGVDVADGGSASFSLGRGQAERATFQAAAGDTRTLAFEDVVTSPAGQPIHAHVYSPDSGAITTATPQVADLSFTGNQIFSLTNLPASGTYTVVLAPSVGVPASFKLTQRFVRAAGVPLPKPVTLQVDAAPAHFAATAPESAVAMVFTTEAGANLDVALTGVRQDNGQDYYYLNIFDPNGNQIDTRACYASWPACPMDVWNTMAGTYTVVATSGNGGSISVDAVVRKNIIGGRLLPGVPKAIDMVEGDTIRYTFDASRSDTMTINLAGIATTPAGQDVLIRVYRPDGGRVLPGAPYSSTSARDSGTLNLASLPVSGTYTVTVSSNYLAPLRASITLAAGSTGGTLTDGNTVHVEANAPGQVAWFDFEATGGGNFDVTLNNVITRDSSNSYYVNVYNAAGAQIDAYYCYASDPACARDFWNLPDGTYRVAISPYNSTSKLSFDAVVRRNRAAGSLVPGVAKDIGRATGDVLRYTFDANQGDTVALHLGEVITTPGGRNTTIRVYLPGVGLLTPGGAYASYNATTAGTLNLDALPASGTYTVVVSSDYLIQAGGTLTLVPAASGAVVPVDTVKHIEANAAGQNIYFDIDVTTAGNYDLTLSGMTSADGSDNYYQVYVYTTAGVNIDGYNCYPSWPGCARDFWNLTPGKYHVIVQPAYATTTLRGNAVMRRNVEQGRLEKSVNRDLTHTWGDVLRYTFDATAGETVALRFAGGNTSPQGYNTNFRVYRPDGGLITPSNQYSSFATRDSQTLNLPNLPSSGVYTVVVSTDYLAAGSGTLTLVKGISGSVLAEGVPSHLEASAQAQAIYFDADFGAGGDVGLTLSAVSSNGGGDYYYSVSVYSPSGVFVDGYNCYPSYPACPRDFWGAAPGRYHVVVQPSQDAERMSFDAVVRHNDVRGVLAFDIPVDITRETGAVLRYTFEASAGDTVALRLSEIANVPGSAATNVRVYRPDGGRIQMNGYYSIFGTTSAGLLNLPTLPVGGAYTVVVSSDFLVGGRGKLTLVTGVTGISLGEAIVAHPIANAPGQSISMDLDVSTQGDFELTLTPSPESAGQRYISVSVLNAAGRQVDGFNCYQTENCVREFWKFPEGRYRVVVTPSAAEDRLNFDARFIRNAERGTLIDAQPVDIAHKLGEVLRFTFNGRRRQSVSLNLTEARTSPSGYTYVRVYRPDGGVITPESYYSYMSAMGDNTMRLANLPIDGDYTVIISSDGLHAGTGNLTLNSATTP